MSWSFERKVIVLAITLVVLLIVVGLPLFFLVYKKPTCSDGVKNQNELGIDCGGSCPRLCQNSFVAPIVKWARADYVAPGLYNIGAYIENYNLNSEILKADYLFKIFDKNGVIIVERKGSMYIPPNRNTLAFETQVNTGKKIIGNITFELLPGYEWQKTEYTSYRIDKISDEFQTDATSASLKATLENKDKVDYENIKVYAILKNDQGNVVGLSQSFLDSLARNSREDVNFTWNESKPNVKEKEIIVIVK